MIAIGGVIGTGLFLGTAGDLENGGPAGLLIGYCVMASLLFSVMVRVFLTRLVLRLSFVIRLYWEKWFPSFPSLVANLRLLVGLLLLN